MTIPRTRHVWLRREYDRRECPGLVLEWQQREGIWWAYVVFILDDRPRMDWVVASSLEPVKTQPNIGSAYG